MTQCYALTGERVVWALHPMLARVTMLQEDWTSSVHWQSEGTSKHQPEVEWVVIGRGKNQFREQYLYLEVSESKWFTKNTELCGRNQLSKAQSTQTSESSDNFLQIDALKSSNLRSQLRIQLYCGKPLPWLRTMGALPNRCIYVYTT